MAKVLVEETNLENIADSIRAKNGTQETYLPSEMSTAIDNIPSGGKVALPSGIRFYGSLASDFSFIKHMDTSESTNMSGMFEGCSAMNVLDISELNTSKVTTMRAMFASINIGVLDFVNSIFDTSKVTDMASMFYGCSGLVTLDLSRFNTSRVTDISNMFSNCSSLVNLNVDSFNLGEINQIARANAFTNCPSLSNNSLNSILKAIITCTRFSTNKQLRRIGLSQAQAEICTTLSNWSDAQSAGWTTGY